VIAPVGAGRRSIAAVPGRGVRLVANGDEDDVAGGVVIAGVGGGEVRCSSFEGEAVGDSAFDGVTVCGLMGAEE
jgi:hypothetical protein